MAKKEKVQYVQLEAARFISDPDYQVMSAEQRGVYCSIIFYLYTNNGRLELNGGDGDLLHSDNGVIALLANCHKTGQQWERVWDFVSRKFEVKNGVLTHKKVTKELARIRKYLKQKSLAGKKGMESRYQST